MLIRAQINGVQFIAYLFFGPETRYIRRGVQYTGSVFRKEYIYFKRIDPDPLRLFEFIQPLALFGIPSVWIPTVAYTIIFGFTSVLLTVEIPQLFLPKFDFNPQELGLQFLGMIVGSLLGEQIGGRISDLWMNAKAKKLGRTPQPEYRLWLSYIGFVLTMVGLIVFGVQLQNAPQGQWNITPIVSPASTICAT